MLWKVGLFWHIDDTPGQFFLKDFIMKILIIEDDAGLNRGISFALAQEGYETVTSRTLKEGLELFDREKPDGVLLDLNLPDGDGMEGCKKIREKSEVPVLMVTARDMEVDELMGLTNGADDYITKPFSIAVLKVRLENLLKRKRRIPEEKPLLVSGEIRMDTKALRTFRGEEELELSMTEYRLLQYFLENKNQVLLKEQILQHIWDADGNFVEENTLAVNISRLRRKIGGNYIRTIQGMGYLWEESR
ncbi:MAG: response regulator transcription factor [Eubacteriales bacterium]|nr:response regulator transcription factor [Eubacteriales bacterium]